MICQLSGTDALLDDTAVLVEVLCEEGFHVPVVHFGPIVVRLTKGQEVQVVEGLVDEPLDHVPLEVVAMPHQHLP